MRQLDQVSDITCREVIACCIHACDLILKVSLFLIIGMSVSNLSDNFLILHVTCDDIKQKVQLLTDLSKYI